MRRSPIPNPDGHFLHLVRLGLSAGTQLSVRGFNVGFSNITTLSVNPDLSTTHRLIYRSSGLSQSQLTSDTTQAHQP